MEYKVIWEMELEADSPLEAAKLAKEIQLDPENIANVFRVQKKYSFKETEIDLDKIEE